MTPTVMFWPARSLIVPTTEAVIASGGTVVDEGGFRYHIFLDSGTLEVTTGGEVEVLLVAGGGGGGSALGGGGGAGGVRLLDGGSALTVANSTTYTITVGAGGAGGSGDQGNSSNGSNSSMVGGAINESAVGGGRGGRLGIDAGSSGGSQVGGSGGGGGGRSDSGGGSAGTSGQGNSGGGGSATSGNDTGAGGGGGAGAAGATGQTGIGGDGGNGVSHWGTLGGAVAGTYGGGGGGGADSRFSGAVAGSGGSGGGGNGCTGSGCTAGSGTANTGGGGGGASIGNPTGGSGGSGIVIVRYPLSAQVPWTPDELGSLVGWWDADAITGLADTDPVSTWSDRSSSEWDATASSGNRPTYRTGVLNSKAIVRFSGSNHLSLGSINLFRNVGGGTIYAVTKDAAITTIGQVFFCSTNVFNAARVTLQSGGGGSGNNDKFRAGGRRLNTDSFEAVVSTQQVTTNWTLLGCVANWTGQELSLFVDAAVDGQNTSWLGGGNTSDTAANSVIIGANRTDNTDGFNGDIAEIVVTHNALSTADRQKLEGYLAHKWGLTANLPIGHPYKDEPPYAIP